ncbi:LacI family DNA-binding transcriptional regulator [Bacillus sp. N9]
MGKPTFKDIAREAGVSHGTVSNVLNGKGNVSVKGYKWWKRRQRD